VKEPQPAKLLRLYASENDTWEGKPLHQAVLAKCRELKIAGATAFRGIEGFGGAAELHTHHWIARDQPIVIIIVDTEDNIARLEPVISEMLHTGAIAISNVEVIRTAHSSPPLQT
jgi:uncharacterized protein